MSSPSSSGLECGAGNESHLLVKAHWVTHTQIKEVGFTPKRNTLTSGNLTDSNSVIYITVSLLT